MGRGQWVWARQRGQPKPPELVEQYVAEQPLKDHIAMNEAAFPGYTLSVEQMIAEDDLVAVIGRASGTHKGPFMGMPPTGKPGMCRSISPTG